MRRRYLWRGGSDGKHHWTELDLNAPPPRRIAPYIRSDLSAYRSIVTGEMIEGRAAHREHLRAHGCIEIGNEYPQRRKEALPPLKDDLDRALQASAETHAEARAAVERARAAEIPIGDTTL